MENSLELFTVPVFAKESKDYYVELNGQRAFVYPVKVSSMATNELYRGTQRTTEETEQASMINFNFSGIVQVRVVVAWEIFNARVLPESKGIKLVRGTRNKGDEVSFEISEPGQYVLEINGLHKPLHIFANPMESDRPDPNAANVQVVSVEDKATFGGNYCGNDFTGTHSSYQGIWLEDGCDTLYFGPGIYHVDKINLKSNQNVYIDGGAIVYGTIEAKDASNIRVFGRGILDGSRFDRDYIRSGLVYMVMFKNCYHVDVEGIILMDSVTYHLSGVAGQFFNVHNIKIFSWRRNADGIDFHNTSDISIHDCFIRTFDDGVSLKGEHYFDGASTEDKPMERVLIERCVFWNDWARPIAFGSETSGERMCDITFRDCDIIHFAFMAINIQACGNAPIYDVLFENIRIGDPIDSLVEPRIIEIFIRSMLWMPGEELGRVYNVTFRNIAYKGLVICPCRFIGASEEHDMRNIYLEQITINGVLLETEDYPISPIIVNDYAQDIYLNGRPIDRAKARFESEEDTCNSYLVGNGAFLVL